MLPLVANAQSPKRIAMATTASASSHYAYSVAASQAINANAEGVEANVIETGGARDNLRRMARNQADVGIVTTNVAFDVYNGVGDFEGKPYKGLMLWIYGATIQNVVVRKDSGIESLEQLAGRKFNPGIAGSGTEAAADSVFATLGIEGDWVRGSTGDIVDQIKDNRVLGYVKSGAGRQLDSSTVSIAALTPIRVLSLTDEQADTVREKLKNLSVVTVADNEAGKDIPGYTTWAYATGFMARPELDEETAYQMTKAVVEDNQLQAGAFAGLLGSDIPKLTMELSATPLHPGAVRYYEEIGIEIPDRLRPAM
jgi:hypothetical protein